MKLDPIIFFDIDDTLRSSKTGRIPTGVHAVIEELHNKGYILCIATGRNYDTIPEEVKKIYAWEYYVCSNGHVITDAFGKHIYRIAFPDEVVKECIRISEETGIALELKADGERFLIKPPDRRTEDTFRYFNMPTPKVKPYTNEEIISIMLILEHGARAVGFERYDAIETLYGESHYCDISLKGFDKVSGIQKVLDLTGCSNFTAIGDSFNDRKMIEKAALGIAMGNAPPAIQKTADYVTDTVDRAGLVKAIRYILKKEGEG